MGNDDIVRIEDVAQRLGVSKETLRSYRARGKGPRSFLLAGRVCYKQSDLTAWIEEQYATTSSTSPAA